jgi:hypothetical protein
LYRTLQNTSDLGQLGVETYQEINGSSQADQTKEENTESTIERSTPTGSDKDLLEDNDSIDPFAECIPLRMHETGWGQAQLYHRTRRRAHYESPRRHGLMSLSMPVHWVDTSDTGDESRFAAELLVSSDH